MIFTVGKAVKYENVLMEDCVNWLFGDRVAWIWWEILPVPLFRVPYSTVLLDKEDEIIGLKTAEDGQLRLQSEGRLPERYVVAVLSFEDRFLCAIVV